MFSRSNIQLTSNHGPLYFPDEIHNIPTKFPFPRGTTRWQWWNEPASDSLQEGERERERDARKKEVNQKTALTTRSPLFLASRTKVKNGLLENHEISHHVPRTEDLVLVRLDGFCSRTWLSRHPLSTLTSLIPFSPFSILLPLENDRNACSEFGGDEKNAITPWSDEIFRWITDIVCDSPREGWRESLENWNHGIVLSRRIQRNVRPFSCRIP